MIDLDKILVKGIGKKEIEHVAAIAAKDKKLYDELVSISLNNEGSLGMKASWIAAKASEHNPGFASHHFDSIVARLEKIQTTGIQREVVKILLHSTMNDERLGKTVQLCFYFLRSSNCDVAVKYHAKSFIEETCKNHPALIDEFLMELEPLLEQHTEAWQAQVKKTMERLKKRKQKSLR